MQGLFRDIQGKGASNRLSRHSPQRPDISIPIFIFSGLDLTDTE